MTDPDDLVEEASNAAFEGWDFTWLGDRSDDPKTPWRYTELAGGALARSAHALDIDTGGGEALAAQLHRQTPRRRQPTVRASLHRATESDWRNLRWPLHQQVPRD